MIIKEKILFSLGVALIVFGIILTFGFLINLFDGSSKHSIGSNLAGFFIAGVLPVVAGLVICSRMKRYARRRKEEETERRILKLASASGNRLTASDVALQTSLSVADAVRILDEMCLKGLARLEISDSGVKVYEFWKIITEDEKAQAERI